MYACDVKVVEWTLGAGEYQVISIAGAGGVAAE